MKNNPEIFSLSLNLKQKNLSIVTAFAENSVVACGMSSKEALSVSLVAEEVFFYLCNIDKKIDYVSIKCIDNIFNFQMSFSFKAEDIDLSMFNVTSKLEYDVDAEVDALGLFLVSRLVDSFYFKEENNQVFLTLIKDKRYTPCETTAVYKNKRSTYTEIRVPTTEEIPLVVQMIAHYKKNSYFPEAFSYPGKIVDMFNGKAIDMLLAFDSSSHICGIIAWEYSEYKSVNFFGPVTFNDDGEKLESALEDKCIELLAKTKIQNMINLNGDVNKKNPNFEVLGEIALFRQLKEDVGTMVWGHKSLQIFLEKEYSSHFLPREITLVKSFGETVPEKSVIASQFWYNDGKVLMRPILFGKDIDSVITQHLKLFKNEKLEKILFEMDLGIAWQCNFTDALLSNNFKPVLIIPYGGVKDIVIFKYKG